ncbi:MAG TPA: hypothetical protein PLY16_00315 [Candidatus Saccharibacteria bacterium]|nr:hypothetical protein [Candidatus Saccharibacteria bacterium]
MLVIALAVSIATLRQRGDQTRQQEAATVALEEANKETEAIHAADDVAQREEGALPVSGAAVELPQTGASLSVIPIGLIVVAAAYYVQSKRMVLRHNRL